ncbi:MAG: hypothetical protein ACKO5K_15500, partial [Armatimonadota bacterium]
TLRTARVRWQDGWPSVPDLEDPVFPARDAVGVWEHRVDRGPANQITVLPDGRFEHGVPASGADLPPAGSWSADGATVTLRWPPRSGSNRGAVDTVRLHDFARTYTGRNAEGRSIHGDRVA